MRKIEYIIVGVMIGMIVLPTQKDITMMYTGSVIAITLDNDKTKAIQLTDIIVKECEDIEAIELAKEMKWELQNEKI